MIKNILKFLLLVIVTAIAFIAVSSILPFSDGFKAGSKDADPSALLYVILTTAWTCLAVFYVVRHASWSGYKLILGLTATLFFVYSFMTQIETLFFRVAFPILTTSDIVLIMVANGVSLFVSVWLGVKLFGKQKLAATDSTSMPKLNSKELVLKLSLIGMLYVAVYFIFGYFVAWQEQALRVFYSGSPEDGGFIDSLTTNFKEMPVIYPFQFMRGILFGAFVLPLVSMFKEESRTLLISLILVYTGTGVSLIIPNFLFPDEVRWAHFREMISSMFVFSLIVWWVYNKLKFVEHKTAM